MGARVRAPKKTQEPFVKTVESEASSFPEAKPISGSRHPVGSEGPPGICTLSF